MIDNVLDLYLVVKKLYFEAWQQIIFYFYFSFPTPSSLSLSLCVCVCIYMYVCVSKGVLEKSVLNTDIHGVSEQEWVYIQCEPTLFMWLCFQHHFHLAFSNISAFSFQFCQESGPKQREKISSSWMNNVWQTFFTLSGLTERTRQNNFPLLKVKLDPQSQKKVKINLVLWKRITGLWMLLSLSNSTERNCVEITKMNKEIKIYRIHLWNIKLQ